MGARDKLEKQYLRNNERFADAFNYFLYGGEQVIDPSKLTEIDSTEIAVPYGSADGKGKRAKTPIQRFRDQVKTWEVLRAMEDNRAVYVVLVPQFINTLSLSTCYFRQCRVGFGRQCHRIASLIRLALTKISGTLWQGIYESVYLVRKPRTKSIMRPQ